MPRPTKAAQTLTPGQKREAAIKAAKNRQRNLEGKAKRYAEELAEMKRAMETKKPKKGRVLNDLPSQPQLKEVAEQNIIFQPNEGPQTDFLSAGEDDVLYGGAAGGGKSYAMIVDPLRYCHLKEHRALILRKTMPELRELIDKTRELYPKAFPGAKYHQTDKRWTFPSGATIEFGYLEKDADVYRYQGQAFSWIGFDEITHLATEFPWQYLQSRLRTTNPDITVYMRATANPGGIGHSWVKKRYVDPANHNEGFIGQDGLTRKFIPAKLKDNPYLHKDGRYQKMLEALPDVHRKRLLEGDWDVSEGAAFPEFSKDDHIIAPFDIPANWNRVKGVDYGYSSPSAVIWAAIDPDDGTVIVYRELYEKGLTGKDLSKRMVEMERNEHRSVSGVLDTAAWNHTGSSGPTVGEELTRGYYGHKLRRADKNRVAGKLQIHEHLKRNESTGKPRLLIFATCPNLIRELTSIPVDNKNPEDVDTNADDHAYDALRYLLMSRPKRIDMNTMQFNIKRDLLTGVDSTFHPDV